MGQQRRGTDWGRGQELNESFRWPDSPTTFPFRSPARPQTAYKYPFPVKLCLAFFGLTILKRLLCPRAKDISQQARIAVQEDVRKSCGSESAQAEVEADSATHFQDQVTRLGEEQEQQQ